MAPRRRSTPQTKVRRPVPKLPGMGAAVGKMLLGSTANKVLQLSSIPVLLLK